MTMLLRIVAGPDAGRTFAIPPEGAIIGRGETATILLADKILSRRHAQVTLDPDGVRIVDLESANGTRVNGQPAQGVTTLRPGDIIEAGASRLRLEAVSDATVVEERQSVSTAVQRQETVRQADEPTRASAATAHTDDRVAVGATLNRRYRLDRLAGQGGFAQVFVAFDLELHRDVALKVLHANLQEAEGGQDLLRRFQQEARAVAALNHANILPIWDYGQVAGSPYLVMPFVDGGSLYERLRNGPRPDLGQIGDWLRQIASALDYAHGRKIVHRDIKPQNMLLNDGDGRLQLADFGIAKVITDAGTLNATGVIGTLSYMAPEQFRGQVGFTTDVYALGCVLFQLLTGTLPFSGSTEQVINGHLNMPVPPLCAPDARPLPAALQGVIARALAKQPEERYPSAGALASAYAAALAEPSAVADPVVNRDVHSEPTEHVRLDDTVVRLPETDEKRTEDDDGRSRKTTRRTFLLAGATSGVTALACLGGVFAIAAANDRAATPTVGLTAAASAATAIPPTFTSVPPTATVAAIPIAATISPTATLVPTPTTVPPTATATLAPPTATLRPAAGDEVLSEWKPLGGADYSLGFDQAVGGYRITVNEVGVGRSQFAPRAAAYTDFELLADCRFTETSNEGAYGVMFHASPTQSGNTVVGYCFRLSRVGFWSVVYFNADRTTASIKADTPAGNLNPPTTSNRLTVSCKNRVVTLGVNGRTVGTIEAVAPATGWLGVYAGNNHGKKGIDAVFSNLRITKL
jgi:serine/threonine-protein kinase